MPEGALTETTAKFNETAAKGEKDEFGRELTAPLSEEGPYYAVQQYIRYYATLGGLRINDGMQVLNTEKQPVEGYTQLVKLSADWKATSTWALRCSAGQ